RGIEFAVVLGPKEMKEGKVVLRNMAKRKQIAIELDKIREEIGE
ncbi:hypothetical protein J7L00_06160, partial [Candidatus Bathyarchaeota archaeon]|nr:hypothetical protein [Candidatus Bathyarchaeota archaeon]